MRSSCHALNSRGEPCQMPAIGGTELCFAHNPSTVRARAAARRRGGEHRTTGAAGSTSGAEVSLRHVAAIQSQLEGVVRDTLAQPNSPARSRTIGYLLALALDAIERGDLAARI